MTTVLEATKLLLSVCDGARTKDGKGYNGGDAILVREMLNNHISENEESKLYLTLHKYKTQLSNFNIDYNKLEREYLVTFKVIPGSEKVNINFGKYKGKTLAEITEIDPNYILWLSENSFNNYIKNMTTKIVNGESIIQTEKKEKVDIIRLILSRDNKIMISAPYKYKDIIKSFSDRKWNPNQKVWEVPLNVLNEVMEKFPDAILSEKVKEIVDKQNTLIKLSDKVSNGNNIEFSDDLKLLPFQTVGVEFIDTNNGNALIADEMGCIDGDALISLHRNGKSFKMKLSILYERFNNKNSDHYKWDLNNSTYARSLTPDGTIRLNKVINVIDKDNKNVIEITTKSGKKLKLTEDHKILTLNGWIESKNLNIGDIILTNGIPLCKLCNSDKNIITYKYTNIYTIFKPKEDIIINIENKNELCHVYDIVMDEPSRNFIANGIIVHNCGKTVQVLAWLRKHPENRPALVVCPASLKLNWKNEANKWLSEEDENIFVINKKYESDKDIYIINYDILKKWNKQLEDTKFNTIIFDESHYMKNGKTQRTKFAEKLSKNIPHKILLTGTPILNRPNELWQQLHIINSDLFPNFFKYGLQYCGAYKTDFGWDFSGATNKEELNEKLKTIMVRRTKSQVLTELPDKRRTSISFDIDTGIIQKNNEYRIAENDFPKYYHENIKNEVLGNGEELVKIEILKQLATKQKMKSVISWINDFLNTGKKLVIFAHHKDVINTISEKFPDISVKLTGSSSMESRQKVVDEFQNNPDIKLFIGNIKAAGVGITLTASSDVSFIELPWTPSDLVQAEDRVHRIGQKNAVNVYYLVAANTIEEDIAYILQKKAKVIDQIIDGKEKIEFNLFDELRKLKGGKF